MHSSNMCKHVIILVVLLLGLLFNYAYHGQYRYARVNNKELKVFFDLADGVIDVLHAKVDLAKYVNIDEKVNKLLKELNDI